jgi:hypothetical protein
MVTKNAFLSSSKYSRPNMNIKIPDKIKLKVIEILKALTSPNPKTRRKDPTQ